MDRVFAFNRRTIEDRTLYVRASSLKEARAKARNDDAFETSDCKVRSATYRLINDPSHD